MLGQHSVFLSTIPSCFQDSVATADNTPAHYSMPAGGKGQKGIAPPEDLAFYLGSKSFPENFSLLLISYNSSRDTPRCLGSRKGEDLSEPEWGDFDWLRSINTHPLRLSEEPTFPSLPSSEWNLGSVSRKGMVMWLRYRQSVPQS